MGRSLKRRPPQDIRREVGPEKELSKKKILEKVLLKHGRN